MTRTPTSVWSISDELVVALDANFGPPVDSYVNGSQTWLREEGPDEVVIEWRLHPVAGYRRPDGVDTYEVLSSVVDALAADGPTLPTGTARAADLWDGLEAFPAYGDEMEPAALVGLVTESLGLAPDAFGLVDHAVIGDAWERSGGAMSIIETLLAQLSKP